MDMERFRQLSGATGKSASPEHTAVEAISVSQLNEYVRSLLAGQPALTDITVRGEISNFTHHRASGHLYFSLKDADGVLSAVMFRSAAQGLRFQPENGMKVLARGTVSVYVRDGKYQLYVTAMEGDGIGSLYLAFEQLKKKLEAEGLFAAARKRPLPFMPRRVGVITSPTGAAVRDIIQIMGRRSPGTEILLFPALVQGIEAPASLCAGLEYFGKHRWVDVIILGRGGGSFEDLYAFNDERLCRLIAASPVPVISAVGHETDFTICDFVADCRAPTPSAAAELAVPDCQELQQKIKSTEDRMRQALIFSIRQRQNVMKELANRPLFTRPDGLYREQTMRLLAAGEQLDRMAQVKLTEEKARFREAAKALEMLNPLAVLLRGYGIAYDDGRRVLTSVKDLNPGDQFCLRLHDGEIINRVETVLPVKKKNKQGKLHEKT